MLKVRSYRRFYVMNARRKMHSFADVCSLIWILHNLRLGRLLNLIRPSHQAASAVPQVRIA